MPRKKLQNRIDNLFAELKEEQEEIREREDRIDRFHIEFFEDMDEEISDDFVEHIFVVEADERESQPVEADNLSGEVFDPFLIGLRNVVPDDKALVKDVDLAEHEEKVVDSHETELLEEKPQPKLFPAVTLPISIQDKQQAVLEILESPGRELSKNELRLVEQVSDQLSLALENAYLFRETQDALAETDRLYQASAEINAVNEYKDILDILRRRTFLGEDGIGSIEILLFDRPQNGLDISGSLIQVGKWVSPDWEVRLYNENIKKHDFYQNRLQNLTALAGPENLIVIENLKDSSLLNDEARSWYKESLRASKLIFVPLNVGGKWIGIIEVVFAQDKSIYPSDLRFLNALASQVAVAIQNLRLLDETRHRAAQLETAAEIARDSSGTLNLEDLLTRSVRLIRERYGYFFAAIYLVDEGGKSIELKTTSGPGAEEIVDDEVKRSLMENPQLTQLISGGEAIVVSNIDWENETESLYALKDAQSKTIIPLKIGERVDFQSDSHDLVSTPSAIEQERVIGILEVYSVVPNAFNPDAIAVLQVLVDQIAVAVDNSRAYELAQQAIRSTRQRVQEISTIYSVSRALSSATMQTTEIAHTVVEEFVRLFNVDRASLLIHDHDENALRVLAVAHPNTIADPNVSSTLVTVEDITHGLIQLDCYPAVEQVMQTLQPLEIHRHQDLFPRLDSIVSVGQPNLGDLLVRQFTQTLILIPLAVKGHSIGIIQMEVRRHEPEFEFDQAKNELSMTIANAAAVALENAQLYEEQIETAEKLRELDQLKSQFLANMSHELRTPLNSIIGFSRVILKEIDGPITELQQQDLTAIHNAGTHLLELINDVLDISKIEAGKMELAFEDDIDLGDLVTSAMSTAIGLTKDKQIRLSKEIDPDLPVVRADSTRIRQVLINFLSNAAKFTDQGEITVRATVRSKAGASARSSGKEVIVSVIDTGPGISIEDQVKLFKPFSQVDSSPTRKVGGSGLGLSISRLLIELHGGQIGVNSELGRGSTFYFTVPVQSEEAEADIQTESELAGDAEIEGAPTVLIVEDDKQVVKLYERYLFEHGFNVTSITDPTKALEAAKEIQPYAITLDLMMPRRDGWQVLEDLKEEPLTSEIPVIVCSILDNKPKGKRLGAVDYLTKPILEEDLIQALNRLNQQIEVKDVLVIDDDPDDLRLVEKVLTSEPGIRVKSVLGGTEGLVAIQTRPPHIIVLDLFMPDVDGFMVLDMIQQDRVLRTIPIIVFTAGDLTEAQYANLKKSSVEVLHKPSVTEEDLKACVNRVLYALEKKF